MWQRAIIVMIFLLVAATLLRLSSNSVTDHASMTKLDFAPVVIDTMPTEEQDAQMLQLRIQATSAMRALAAKSARREIPTRQKNQSRLIADALNRPKLGAAEVLRNSEASP